MAISTAVDVSAVARVVGIKTEFKNLRGGGIVYLPQRIAVVGQGSSSAVYSTDKIRLNTESEVGDRFGYGSPLHLAAKMLMPVNGDGVRTVPVTFYPLEDHASGVAAEGTITPSGAITGTGAFRVLVNNIRSEAFTLTEDDTVATTTVKMAEAINSILEMPVTAVSSATEVTITSKWQGVSANGLVATVEGTEGIGISFAITQPTGGLNNPDVQPALDKFGNVWETMVLNLLDSGDTAAIEAFSVFGEGRWGALTRKPLVVFTGNTGTDVATVATLPESRKTDRVNAYLTAPGSTDLPFVVAARQLARIAPVANNNPARDYGSQQATLLNPGSDEVQWTYPDRDQAVKSGVSTVQVKDGVVNLSDIVTFYHPTGDPNPAYRYVVDIVKLQNIIFNIDLIFNNPEWDGAPLLPDDQPTANRDARKPKSAVAAVCAMHDSLALEAIISDPEAAKEATMAQINEMNPKRLDLSTTVKLSGNANIISADLNFGFFFGAQQIVA